ncbi:MAG: DUF2958 domain-containing protein [Phenylobacterium sp.]|uniref:DUF2958 domain-containing protein n=1 Tax=Phenylobacterium sp. TaxID=1871053 RepID=UPI003BB5CB39
MTLLPAQTTAQLLRNGHRQAPLKGTAHEIDFIPVVKLFAPDGGATWLLTELDPDDPDIAFGLCDLGLGFPELGYVSLRDIAHVRGRLGLLVERDRLFRPQMALSAYAERARAAGRITV